MINYDGGQMTLDCVDSLRATEWPADRLEIVVVDNGSIDGIADRLRSEYPSVRVLEPFSNLGFAGGCNLGIRATGDYDYVALINNDSVVEPGWLAPLVARMRSGERIGAVSPKMLFYERYHDVTFDVPGAQRPRGDGRELGVRVSAVRIDGRRLDEARLGTDEGFHAPEPPNERLGEELARWSSSHGSLRIVARDGEVPQVVSLRLHSLGRQRVRLTSGSTCLDVVTDAEPVWFDLPIAAPVDVIQNAGSGLFNGGFGGDVGFHEPDLGQRDEAGEVFAWCGGAAVLDPAYLNEVGLFDERLFLYYEDTDLAWRGRLAGWTYWYEPTSVVRHRHAQSSGGTASTVFRFHVERNRLLMLAKNAPASVAAGVGDRAPRRRSFRDHLRSQTGAPAPASDLRRAADPGAHRRRRRPTAPDDARRPVRAASAATDSGSWPEPGTADGMTGLRIAVYNLYSGDVWRW
ncbi:MAG: glycosyltransferase [Ilumatobacteraceae bacterium]